MTRTQLLLIQLAEECNEVAQRVSKALRFGLDETQVGYELNNAQRLRQEFIDLIAVYSLLIDEGVVTAGTLGEMSLKRQKVEKYMQLSLERGVLKTEEELEAWRLRNS